jgi:hypothetical protein
MPPATRCVLAITVKICMCVGYSLPEDCWLTGQVMIVRQGRKRKAAEVAISDPAQFARSKLAKNLKKRQDRKKKIDKVRELAHKPARRPRPVEAPESA